MKQHYLVLLKKELIEHFDTENTDSNNKVLSNKLLNLIDNYEIIMDERDKALFSLREMSYEFDRTRMKLKDLEGRRESSGN